MCEQAVFSSGRQSLCAGLCADEKGRARLPQEKQPRPAVPARAVRPLDWQGQPSACWASAGWMCSAPSARDIHAPRYRSPNRPPASIRPDAGPDARPDAGRMRDGCRPGCAAPPVPPCAAGRRVCPLPAARCPLAVDGWRLTAGHAVGGGDGRGNRPLPLLKKEHCLNRDVRTSRFLCQKGLAGRRARGAAWGWGAGTLACAVGW